MELFFSPLSCSLASRITMYEAGIDAAYTRVDGKTKTTSDGRNYLEINPRGQVPAIKISDGEILTENVSILEYLADLAPKAGLAPTGIERTRMRKWLAFVNSEVHVGAFSAIFSSTAPPEAKAYAIERAKKALAHVDKHLEGRDWLTNSFSIADVYLSVVGNWLQSTPIKLADFPNVAALQKRVFSRPAAGKAVAEELALYRAAA
ncbi:MAG: glutathione binding-like protein [Hyphomonadaceae bacterium]|nr:glutathione binding-like protein [Hyphomonadaceae bacterium]